MKFKEKIISLILAMALSLQAIAFVRAAETEVIADTGHFYGSDRVYASDLANGELLSVQVGYDSMRYDKNLQGKLITLNVDGAERQFLKGILIHAPSEIVYDVRSLKEEGLTRFRGYAGVDASRGSSGDGVVLSISTSTDNVIWTEVVKSSTLKGNTDAYKLDIDISDAEYLKITFGMNSNDGNDHSVIADAMFCKPEYQSVYTDYGFIKTVDEYDEELAAYGSDITVSSQALRSTLYKRTLVNNVGYDYLQMCANYSDMYRKGLEWLFNDFEALDMYINGGAPEGGSYTNSIRVLLELYTKYSEDIGSDLYKRMMITLSLTHAQNVTYWLDSTQTSDPIKRYNTYKRLYEKGYLLNEVFENLTVEEMRWVMNNISNDEEIEWLNYYVRKTQYGTTRPEGLNIGSFKANPYDYITYTFGYDYYLDKYYSEDNKADWQNEYHLINTEAVDDDDDFDIDIAYESGHPKLWIVFEEGAVCGGISKTGSNILTAFGVPSVVIGQPGHAAYLRYRFDDASVTDGSSPIILDIYNDISGWTQSEKGERMPLAWGSDRTGFAKEWDNKYRVAYVLLSQACIDDYDNLIIAEDYVKLAKLNENDFERAKQLYEKAISVQELNVDAWIGLINLYKNNNASDEEMLHLAKELSETFTYHPLPMYDMIKNLIQPALSNQTAIADLTSYANAALHRAAKATDEDVLQADACRIMADYIMGNYDTTLATFSFDGDNAGEIVLSEKFANTSNRLLYSLDGGAEWKDAGMVSSVKLSDDEIKSINSEDDILVKLQGSSDHYAIDISDGSEVSGVYLNDNENRLIGSELPLEYSTDDGITWEKNDDIRFEGEQTILVRNAASGTQLAGEVTQFTFTEDTHPDTRSYITLDKIRLTDFSTEAAAQGGSAQNALDGTPDTIWHTDWGGGDDGRYVTSEFTKPVYLSGFDYTPRQSGLNGIFSRCDIYTSLDGVTWTLSASADWAENNNKKSLTFDEPVYTRYVKVVGSKAYGNFGSAAMFEFFEDKTYSIDSIKEINIDSMPNNTEYGLNTELDLTGLEISAVLDDSSTRELLKSEYTIDTSDFDSSTAGEKSIWIKINDSDVVKDFTLKVFDVTPVINGQPSSAVYTSVDEIKPLTVSAVMSDGSEPVYKWYRSIDGKINKGIDEEITDAVGAAYTPGGSGYYYAVISGVNSATIYTDVAHIMVGDYEAVVNNTGYNTVGEAALAASSGDTVEIQRDITLSGAAVVIDKDITLKSKESGTFTVTRGADISTSTMFDIREGSLTFDNVIIDGGATWTGGNFNQTLNRYIGNIGVSSTAPVVILRNAANLTLDGGSAIQNNHNTSGYGNAGGAILALNNSTLHIKNGDLMNNQCDSYGGAVMLKNNASVIIDSGRISGNYSPNSGGTFCVDHTADFVLNGGIIENNLCDSDGGVVWLSNGSVAINGGNIRNNVGRNGDGVYMSGSGSVAISGFDSIEDDICVPNGKHINISGDLSGKSLPVTVTGSIDKDRVVAEVSESRYLEGAMSVLTVDGYAKAKSGNSIKAVNQRYDYNNDNYVDKVDSGLLLKSIAGLSVGEHVDSDKAENKTLSDVIALMTIFE